MTKLFRSIALVTITLACLANGCSDPNAPPQAAPAVVTATPKDPALQALLQKAQDLVAKSTVWRELSGKLKDKPDELRAGWKEELERLGEADRLMEGQPVSTGRVVILYRLGWAEIAISPKGSAKAEEYLVKARRMLLEVMGKGGPVEQANELMSAILSTRGDNLTLLGDDKGALACHEESLVCAQACTYKGQLAEGTIRNRLAGIHFRAERWEQAIEHGQLSIDIVRPLADNDPAFKDKDSLLSSLWFVANSKKKVGAPSAEDFALYRKYGGK